MSCPKAIFEGNTELQGVRLKEILPDAAAIILQNTEEGEQPSNVM